MRLLLLLLLLWQPADGLFLHTSSAIIRKAPTSPGTSSSSAARSLFGYRVAIIKGESANVFHLLVTDPVGYHPATKSASGTAHLCPVSIADFNTSRVICDGSGLPFSQPVGDSDSFVQFSLFGASLASLPDGQFVVCAPGHNFASPAFNLTATPGLCGYWRSSSAEPIWLQKFFPYMASSKDDKNYGNCLGGFQAALARVPGNSSQTQLTVSGPFCMMQRLAFFVKNDSASLSVQSGVFDSKPTEVELNELKKNYLGYSLATDPDSGVVYATSPFFHEKSDTLLAWLRPGEVKAKSIEARMGQPFYDYLYRSFNYLGYSSAVISESLQTKRKAVLLGAPFHSDGLGAEGLDRGCIFVLTLETLGKPIDRVSSMPARYCGRERGGRLGTDVVGIGDVNYDDIEDFAVGCPGCGVNGTGAVYLFLGMPNYANPTAELQPFEIVNAADLSSLEPNITGFGWSLALAPDLDNNTVSELVVGAISSHHAVVLPGRLLLITAIDFHYVNATIDEVFKTDIMMHSFSSQLSRPIGATIRMHTKAGVDLSNYQFNLRVRPEELASTEQQRRFLIELIDCPSAVKPGADGWCELTRVPGKSADTIQFTLMFRLRPLPNNQRHSSPDGMLRDLVLLMHWRMTDRVIVTGSSSGFFPAVLQGRRVFPGYEDVFSVPLYKFKTGVCDPDFGFNCNPTGNIRLELLGKPSILLNSYQQLQVTLRIRKQSSYPYYGGMAIRLTPSDGVHVLDAVTLRTKTFGRGGNESVSEARYFSQHKEVLLTEPFPDPPDVLTRNGRGQIEVTLRLNFDGRRTAYRVGFRLLNLLGDIAGYQDFVTRDGELMNNWAELSITFNTSVSLRLLSATDESMIADARQSKSINEAKLMALSGATAASVVGPGLQQTFELLASTRPAAAIRGLSISIRVPLVTDRGHLLLYFPKNALAWSHATEVGDSDRVSQYLPGLPFTSDDAEGFIGNQDRECQPLEPNMAVRLAKPPLTLLENQHEVNIFNSINSNELGDNSTFSETHGTRQRRSLEETSSTSPSSTNPTPTPAPQETDPTFDCDRPELAPVPFRCVTFNCPVRDLGRDGVRTVDRVFLHLHARLWSPTYFRHHLSRFNIRSQIQLNLPPPELFAFRNVDVAGNSSILQTFLFLSIRPPIVDQIPWGYIILAIFLGIWLLLLLILLLWYCNFFHRKKPPQDYNSVPQKDANDDDFYR
ncbi:hypothetical protein BOX15_Mlig016724g1 [Macrostomum lignano]|uniref:Integrin alpha third immunoglobulin-like domain-containing protein n=1 Tax=Macrostomum lignano TaxID=282301 RepID=A0A267GEN2_9PLAT|nr:hypothetical protein BOX15_Mlig016724g1 [Macrostomum lignano]